MRTARDVPTPLLCRNSMISRITFCSAQPPTMRSARFGPIPVTSRRRPGSLLNDLEHGLTEHAHQLPRVDRPDATDHAGAEVLLDPFDRRWRCGLEERGLELDAVGAVVDPVAARLDELAGRDHRRVAEDGDQVALAARLDPQHAEPILLVVERD